MSIWLNLTLKETALRVYLKSPGAYIFHRPFLRRLILEGLIFGGVYLRREIRVSKLIGLAWLINGRKFTVFAMFSKYKLPGGLYLEEFIFGILPNSNLPGLRFFVYCICFIMWHSYLNCMQTPSKKISSFYWPLSNLKYRKEAGFVENVRISNKFLKNTSLAMEGR